jgi:hypothetical protein
MPIEIPKEARKEAIPSRQLAFPAALACALCVLLMTVLGGLATPGYSHASQFISELGASRAAHEYLVRFLGFLPAGITLLAFCRFASASLPRSRLTSAALLALAIYALGYVAAAFFPCDLGCRPKNPSASQIIHNLVGGVGYLLAPGFLFVLALRARSWPASAPLPMLGFVAAGVALLGLLSLSPASPYVGFSQRAIEASVLVWVLACGWYIRARSCVVKTLEI